MDTEQRIAKLNKPDIEKFGALSTEQVLQRKAVREGAKAKALEYFHGAYESFRQLEMDIAGLGAPGDLDPKTASEIAARFLKAGQQLKALHGPLHSAPTFRAELEGYKNEPPGLPTPDYWGLDHNFIKYVPHVVGGFAGTGKSSFLLNLAAYYAQRKHRVIVYSLEMSRRQLLTKLITVAAEFVKAYCEILTEQNRQ